MVDAGDTGLILELGRSPREGNGSPFQYPCLKISWSEEPIGLQSEVSQSQTQQQEHEIRQGETGVLEAQLNSFGKVDRESSSQRCLSKFCVSQKGSWEIQTLLKPSGRFREQQPKPSVNYIPCNQRFERSIFMASMH